MDEFTAEVARQHVDRAGLRADPRLLHAMYMRGREDERRALDAMLAAERRAERRQSLTEHPFIEALVIIALAWGLSMLIILALNSLWGS
jgi:hypothetical protein